ncbi:hypothetical protein D9K81_06200 [Acinetobacter chengduensis]|uniref:Uncharacterized protein n=1 Tax=Acinetobacter chengduensis TaxID=2420890 RepID=A0ABX9TY41_9GAMM|nr:hypothetical protein D7V31_06975 [Acinetobacter sp. WCHAc060007]RLL22788.1 hypothetical protein D9K81_06200 [Acinetobacter chengduensis]
MQLVAYYFKSFLIFVYGIFIFLSVETVNKVNLFFYIFNLNPHQMQDQFHFLLQENRFSPLIFMLCINTITKFH